MTLDTLDTIERRASIYEQIKRLKPKDIIEVTTDRISLDPFAGYFLKK